MNMLMIAGFILTGVSVVLFIASLIYHAARVKKVTKEVMEEYGEY